MLLERDARIIQGGLTVPAVELIGARPWVPGVVILKPHGKVKAYTPAL